MRILLSLLLLLWPAWLLAETRVALVLASSQYEALRPLENPLNDARLIEDKLLALGFEVYSETNRDLRRMRRALDNFAEDAAGADVALIYFAGHGMEVAGQNMLLPVDAPAGTVAELTAGALPLDDLARTLQEVAPVGLLIVDACRTEPFGGAGRGAVALHRAPEVKPGLARIGRSDKLLYAFAAAPGQAASDGQGANSPFTEALARHLATPGLEIRQVLTLVQQDVYDRTRGQQLPYVESGLPSVVFAGGQSALPEREVLLLSMARMTPDHRALVESVAADHDMPLAPLFGAFLSANLAGRTQEDQLAELTNAANAFTELRRDAATLSAADPQVAALRAQAAEQRDLGAFHEARALIAKAIEIDASSGDLLEERTIARRLSEADSHYINAQSAQADLRRDLVIADYEKAIALYEKVWDWQGEVPYRLLHAADDFGHALSIIGKTSNARLAYLRLLKASEARLADDPMDLERRYWVALANERLGDVALALGESDAAEVHYSLSLKGNDAIVKSSVEKLRWLRSLSVSYENLGDIAIEKGDIQAAQDSYEKSREIRSRLLKNDPMNFQWQSDYAVTYQKIGGAHLLMGDLHEAREAYETSTGISELLFSLEPENTDAQLSLAHVYGSLGRLERENAELEKSVSWYLQSIRILDKLIEIDPKNASLVEVMSANLNMLGLVYEEAGDLLAARLANKRAFHFTEYLADLDHENTGRKINLAVSFIGLSVEHTDDRERRKSLRRALDILLQLNLEGKLTEEQADWISTIKIALERKPQLTAPE